MMDKPSKLKGRHFMSDEAKEKISKARKDLNLKGTYTLNENTKEKISKGKKDLKFSPEHKENIRQSIKDHWKTRKLTNL